MKEVTYGIGGYDPNLPNNNVLYVVDIPDSPTSLEGIALVATLNAVLGVWELTDAANIAGVTSQDLIHEAQAWAVAKDNQ